MKRIIGIICSVLLQFSIVQADDDPEPHLGVELDVLPYLTGGYYLSGWLGEGAIRYRAIYAVVNVPEFATKKNFNDHQIKSTAFVVDYFPRGEIKDLWIGGGIEFWSSKIKSDVSQKTAEFSDTVATMGAGYIWFFHPNFYLNPWGAVHLVIAGDERVSVGGHIYKPEKFSGELSLKFGWQF